jgi:hypothetical protein
MSDPWPLVSASGNNEVLDGLALSPLYYGWVAQNYTRFNGIACLCNWFPLNVLVEFAADKGFRVRLDYWPGSAPNTPTKERFWDTAKKLIFDSHGGEFENKTQYLSRVRSKVTARMIGSLNSVAITQSEARAGDLVSRDYNDRYWHVELITNVSAGVITTQAGSAPDPVVPKEHENKYYRSLADQSSVFQGKPRRWEFEEVLSS